MSSELPQRGNKRQSKKPAPAPPSNGRMPTSDMPVTMPVAEYVPPNTHCQNTFMVRLTSEQAIAMARLVDGMRHNGKLLRDGHVVDAPQNVVRWLCEQVTK